MPITPNSARAVYGLRASADPSKTQVSGGLSIGVEATTLPLTGATKAYCVSATLANADDTLTTDITTAFATTGSPFEVGPLALLSDGSLLAGSPSGNGNIYQFGTDGTLLSTFASGLGQVGGIATAAAVPEPGTLGLAAISIVAGGLWLRRRRVEGARA
jgi:hypothetical protein